MCVYDRGSSQAPRQVQCTASQLGRSHEPRGISTSKDDGNSQAATQARALEIPRVCPVQVLDFSVLDAFEIV